MPARNLREAVKRGISIAPVIPSMGIEPTIMSITGEIRDYIAHAHGRWINKLRLAGKPMQTADFQILEFLQDLLSDDAENE